MADDDFKQHSDNQSAAKRQRDFDDLQNEQSDRDSGRIRRFGVNKAVEAEIKRNKDAAFRSQMTALEQLLNDDPIYAAIYTETMDLLSEAEIAADAALDQAKADLIDAESSLEGIQYRANQLPDGTRIYKDADGKVWTEDGRLVSQDELPSVVWKDGAPSREDFLAGRDAVDDAKQRIKNIEDYIHRVLGPARDRITDPDNPASKDEIKGIHDDIKDGLSGLGLAHSSGTPNLGGTERTANIKLPDLAG